MLFATWARAPGHPLYAAEGMPATPAQMTARVSAHYAEMAEAIGARVAGVGDAFLSVAARPGAAALHAGDGYHASAEGARLAASILAAAILGRPVAPLPERAWRDPGAPPAVQPVRSIVAR
ncbi:MAG: hypothetical protein RQ752_15705 [Thermohalobaculum sp.]|nr:hypothetical protein [Thermohalobaculum sp.]